MKKKFSWVQISDLHIFEHTRWEVMLRAYEELAEVLHPDFLVVSGDYRHLGKKTDFQSALGFLRRLTELFHLEKRDVYLVPGNHDVNDYPGRKAFLDSVQKRIVSDCDAYREYLSGAADLRQGFSEYAEFVKAFYGDDVDDDRVRRPADVLCLTRKRQVNLLLLNTALCARGNREEKEVFDVHAFSKLQPDPSLPTLVLAHHKPDDLVESQREELVSLLNRFGVRAYLCGDCHRLDNPATVARFQIPHTTVPVYVCGKSAVENGDLYSDLSVMEFTCCEDGNAYVQVYRYQKHHFLLANDFYHHVNRPDFFPMFEVAQPLPSTEPLYNHAYLDKPHPEFRKRTEPAGFSPMLRRMIRVDGEDIPVLYHELFGNARNEVQEYVEGRNLFLKYDKWEPEYREYVRSGSFDDDVREERLAAKQRGYTHHPKKLCLSELKENKDEHSLTLVFGKNGYLEHRVYRREMEVNPAEQQKFLDVISQPKGNNSKLDRCPWATCGGGVWIITGDGYLAVSKRSNSNVAEVPGMLSYSASGSMDRTIELGGKEQKNTPGLAVAKEIEEELGIPRPRAEELTLISLGVDTGRYLIQFSYVWECGLTSGEIIRYRRNCATTPEEQKILFFPFRKDVCSRLLLECEFEPGAMASLNRLLEKRFG